MRGSKPFFNSFFNRAAYDNVVVFMALSFWICLSEPLRGAIYHSLENAWDEHQNGARNLWTNQGKHNVIKTIGPSMKANLTQKGISHYIGECKNPV